MSTLLYENSLLLAFTPRLNPYRYPLPTAVRLFLVTLLFSATPNLPLMVIRSVDPKPSSFVSIYVTLLYRTKLLLESIAIPITGDIGRLDA